MWLGCCCWCRRQVWFTESLLAIRLMVWQLVLGAVVGDPKCCSRTSMNGTRERKSPTRQRGHRQRGTYLQLDFCRIDALRTGSRLIALNIHFLSCLLLLLIGWQFTTLSREDTDADGLASQQWYWLLESNENLHPSIQVGLKTMPRLSSICGRSTWVALKNSLVWECEKRLNVFRYYFYIVRKMLFQKELGPFEMLVQC